ncbi:hydrogenase maturation protease [Mycobacterium sp. UM_Kg1]|uniref:hydrogenase maturation protease n=1 Tax=Mycobacterium sp. UM_Kg1 TaxID=1545691 RepID=UPI00061B0D2D|nr:hydrogenase maturation protease [Mycobacterium sp. UM_Kg1]
MGDIVVIGLGNTYRRDDGVGAAAALLVGERLKSGVHIVTGIADPAGLLEAWDGAALAVVIDATITGRSTPGQVGRWGPEEVDAGNGSTSSHSLNVARTFALGQALKRAPEALVLLTVEVAEIGYGPGLSPAVAAAVPTLVTLALSEIGRRRTVVRATPIPGVSGTDHHGTS